jgi:ElaB/YqjD/DUF883 family membrane-anchored ribosome-binding protein
MENSSNPTARTGETLIKDVNNLKKDLVKVAHDARDHAAAHVTETKRRVQGAIGETREQLTSHPLTLFGVGLFLGFLLGVRFNRHA